MKEQEEQPLFCLEEGHFKTWFCFAELLSKQWTAGAQPVPGLWLEQSQPTGHGGDPSGTNPGSPQPWERREAGMAPSLSISGGGWRLYLGSGQFLHRQQHRGAVPQGGGVADVFLDLLNESIMFFLLFSHLHQQLLPAKRARVICLFVGRRKNTK